MDKITDTNIIDTLRDIMNTNTVHYKTDFDIFMPMIQDAANSADYREKSLFWLSYPSGVMCGTARDVFQQNTYNHNSWKYYENTSEHVLAYAVELKTIDKSGDIMGDIYELNIHEHAEFVRKNAVLSDYYTVTCRNGDVQKIPKSDFHYANYDMREVVHTQSEPNDPAALDALIEQEYGKRLTEPYNIVGGYEHTERLRNEHAQFEAARIQKKLANIDKPNTPDKKAFRVELSMYYTTNTPRNDLKRLFKAVPYKSMKICKFSDIDGTYAMIDKREIMNSRKPSLVGQVRDNIEVVKFQTAEKIGKSRKKDDLEV